MDNTTIQVSKDTKKELDKQGGKGDTYDLIIKRMLAALDGRKRKK